ncbi:MAG TPA: sugar ABC transporter permease [Fibrobacteria bacterium]|nr:sugar ABC transporter permease [Fibrobacteria bacterium]
MKRALVLLLAIPALWLLFHALSDGAVLTAGNMVNLFKYVSVVGILAAGMTLVIGAGHIDLSVGSLLGFLGAANAYILASTGWGWPLPAALAASALLGLAAGGLHGGLTAWFRVPSFIVTLSGLLAYMGLKQYLANPVIPLLDDTLIQLGQGYVTSHAAWILTAVVVIVMWGVTLLGGRKSGREYGGVVLVTAGLCTLTAVTLQDRGIPYSVVALGAAGLLCHVIAQKTRAGRYAFALGSNAEAARYAGLPVRGIVVFVFALMGLMAWLSGLVATSQLMAGAADIGDQQELYAIAACVLGGTSLRGGSGNVWMSILGALLMASILNGMEQMGVASTIQKIILGIILVTAVAADQWTQRKERFG